MNVLDELDRTSALEALSRLQDSISEVQRRGDALRDQLEDPNRPAIGESVGPLVQQIHEAAQLVFRGVGDVQAATS